MLKRVAVKWVLMLGLCLAGGLARAEAGPTMVPTRAAAIPAAAAEAQTVLALARDLIERVRYGALITVDSEGQPRSRVVDAFSPTAEFVVWVATRPNTRKVAQIRAHQQVTLYYWDPESRSYVSIMGGAEIVDDLPTKLAMRREADNSRLYPQFPADYVLIKVTPVRLEGVLPGYRGDKDNWAPVAVDFAPANGESPPPLALQQVSRVR